MGILLYALDRYDGGSSVPDRYDGGSSVPDRYGGGGCVPDRYDGNRGIAHSNGLDLEE